MSKSAVRRIRKSFGKIAEVAPIPNLIEVQKKSYEGFLQFHVPREERKNQGLENVFRSVFPIRDFAGLCELEYVRYDFDAPKYDIDECRQRGLTFAAPLRVSLRLVVWSMDQDTGAKSVQNIKEQDVYMGDMPLMTEDGTFIINGTERVIVSQMHRSPGAFFDHDEGKTHSSGKYLFGARIIPSRGSWIDLEFDPKDLLYVRIDRRRKILATTLLKKDQWKCPLNPSRFKGIKISKDIVDAKTGDVVIAADSKMTPRQLQLLEAEKDRQVIASESDVIGAYIASDLFNKQTGELLLEAGEEITPEILTQVHELGIKSLSILSIDHINVGPYIRNTLVADKNRNRIDALVDIYRVLRPGEPPTLEGADTLFWNLFFDSEKYDLSPVGRVKMNARLGFENSDGPGVLRKKDIIKILHLLVELKDGRGEIDDIDHLGNRRVRSVGELLENQYRIGLLRMERSIRERMGSVELDTVMPHDLINAKPASAAVREFFTSSQLSQFMDQTNPLSEITH